MKFVTVKKLVKSNKKSGNIYETIGVDHYDNVDDFNSLVEIVKEANKLNGNRFKIEIRETLNQEIKSVRDLRKWLETHTETSTFTSVPIKREVIK